MPGEHIDAYLVFVNEVPVQRGITFTIRENRKNTVIRGVVGAIYKPLFVNLSFEKFDFSNMKSELVEI